jgi:F-type H+-transporting ATPase subunit c
MILLNQLIHYISLAVSTALSGLTVSLGQGGINKVSLDALNRQPEAKSDIQRSTLLALALTETSSLLCFLVSIVMFLQNIQFDYQAYSSIAMSISITVPGFITGLITSLPAREAIYSISRQPFFARKITNLMLLAQSLIQTPLIFGLVISLFIRYQSNYIENVNQSLILIAAALAFVISSIGPAIGVGILAKSSCKNAGINNHAFNKLFSFTIISQAIIETPIIFATIISFWMINIAKNYNYIDQYPILYFFIAFAIAIGTISPGINSGRVASIASNAIAYNPDSYNMVSKMSLLTQGLIETCVIYAFIISLALMIL